MNNMRSFQRNVETYGFIVCFIGVVSDIIFIIAEMQDVSAHIAPYIMAMGIAIMIYGRLVDFNYTLELTDKEVLHIFFSRDNSVVLSGKILVAKYGWQKVLLKDRFGTKIVLKCNRQVIQWLKECGLVEFV